MLDTEAVKNIVEESKDYLDSQLELAKLSAIEKSSKGISVLLTSLILGAFLLLILICISLFFGFLLADVFDSFYKGFGLVALIYLILFLLTLLLRKKIITLPLQNKVIKEFFKDE